MGSPAAPQQAGDGYEHSYSSHFGLIGLKSEQERSAAESWSTEMVPRCETDSYQVGDLLSQSVGLGESRISVDHREGLTSDPFG